MWEAVLDSSCEGGHIICVLSSITGCWPSRGPHEMLTYGPHAHLFRSITDFNLSADPSGLLGVRGYSA